MPETPGAAPLKRELGLFDAIVVGLGAMLGAGVVAAFGPAASAAGTGLLLALALAAVVAYGNATSSAAPAAVHPLAGGTYLHGRRQLGPLWGFVAGWGFVVGKTASCVAMALNAGAYAWPAHPRVAAVVAALVLAAVNYRGVAETAALTRLLVTITLLTVGVVLVACFGGGSADPDRLRPLGEYGLHGVLQAAGLHFFAFAGYARIATLDEEVRNPAQTTPRAVPQALLIVVVTYAVVGVAVLLVLGADGTARSDARRGQPELGAGLAHALVPGRHESLHRGSSGAGTQRRCPGPARCSTWRRPVGCSRMSIALPPWRPPKSATASSSRVGAAGRRRNVRC